MSRKQLSDKATIKGPSAATARLEHSRYFVLWFFFFALMMTFVGQGIHHCVVDRITAAMEPGSTITDSPLWSWMPYGFYITNVGPSMVGLLMTISIFGLPGLWRIAVQLSPLSVGRAWPILVVCLFLPLGFVVIPVSVLIAVGVSGPTSAWSLSTYVYSAIVSCGLIGPGICEELGWRGFALPLLQRRYTALVSSLIIGAVRGFWHWPNYFLGSIHPYPLWSFAVAIPIAMATSTIYTWVYNSTAGSLFAVVVLHGATASTPGLSDSFDSVVTFVVPTLYVVIAIGLVCWFGPANLSHRKRVEAELTNMN